MRSLWSLNKVLGFWLRYVGGVLAVAIWAYGVAVLAAVLLPPDMLVQSIFLVIAFPMVIVGVAVVLRRTDFDPSWTPILAMAGCVCIVVELCVFWAVLSGFMTPMEALLVIPVVCFGIGGLVVHRWVLR